MEKLRYMISDAAAAVEVETHVLRYWEEELGLSVPRNDMGHRYYTKENLDEFMRIKELKEEGYQLREIRNILHGEAPAEAGGQISHPSEAKMEQFREIMTEIIGHAVSLNNEEICQRVGTEVREGVLKEINYLMREQEDSAEDRYRKLDAAIRGSVQRKWILNRSSETRRKKKEAKQKKETDKKKTT